MITILPDGLAVYMRLYKTNITSTFIRIRKTYFLLSPMQTMMQQQQKQSKARMRMAMMTHSQIGKMNVLDELATLQGAIYTCEKNMEECIDNIIFVLALYKVYPLMA